MKKSSLTIFRIIVSLFLILILCSNHPVAQAAEKKVINAQQSITMPRVEGERLNKLLNYVRKSKHPVKNLNTRDLKKLGQESSPYEYSISSQGDLIKSNTSLHSSNQFNSIFLQPKTTDNRVQINPTTSFPYNAIAQIDFTDGTYGYSCTGWFVDHNTVVTAAHCVYNAYNKKFYQGWAVYPAENGTDLPYGGEYTTEAYVSGGWQNTTPPSGESIYYKDVGFDYAVINLSINTNFPNHLSINSSVNVNDDIYSVGYPGDKSFQSNGSYYYYMYRSYGIIGKIESSTITHDAFVTAGMSGGPIMRPNSWGIVSLNSTSSWGPQLAADGPRGLIQQWGSINQ